LAPISTTQGKGRHRSKTQNRFSSSFSSSVSTTSTSINNTSANDNDSNDDDSNMTKNRFRLVSYNLLSSHLAEPDYHTKCDPEHLSAEKRFPKIIAKLQEQLDNNNSNADANADDTPVIFCLQEVSHDWAKQLHIFFANNGYHFITALYGRSFNGYMGIGTAYPLQYYDTVNVDICRLSDKRDGGWPRPREGIDYHKNADDGLVTGFVKKYFFRPLVDTAQYVGIMKEGEKGDKNVWEKSEYRSNKFVAVKLQRKQKGSKGCGSGNGSGSGSGSVSLPPPIWIGNYHMPCAFREPAVMTLHCDLVAHRIQKLASEGSGDGNGNSAIASDVFALAGDFNIMPDSAQYKFLTTGKLCNGGDGDTCTEEADKAATAIMSPIPPERYGVKWESDIVGMKSAYASYEKNNGKESDFTNYAHNGALSDESFIGTLDYIFLSGNCEHQWNVVDVLKLKHRDEVLDGPFPNENEPSDHVMIAATLEI